ncbi:hypothetical protein COY32_01775 [candidate division WWE3 bacterium CG_4_10_14_0_2_um_filter_41_14]|uniref:DUF304 domain-containing protein n=1 Tax=candidate division WWE3 bacterium CG_4_10_14_0_2_um_filter_41_14 TaxID=1975072 RepID=A0A2M7TKI7_UNCKA|nr:MAG: hypothetical protein COY32_01775 [candidate division WWE3 bacterium CG_4_10_14_0_2_um_filter_41_14]
METKDKNNFYHGIEFEPDETVVMFVRQHWFVFRNSILLMLFVPFVLMSFTFFLDYIVLPEFLRSTWMQNFLGQLLIWVSEGSFVLGLSMFLWQFNLWRGTFYLLTDKRLVLVTQRALFTHDDRETSLQMIQDVRATIDGLQATLYGYGNVVVQVSSQDAQLVLEKVGRPREVQRTIIREAHLKPQSTLVK